MVTLKDLEAKRRSLIKKVTKVQLQVTNLDPATVTLAELELLHADLADKKEKLDELYDETEVICPDVDFPQHEADFDTIMGAVKRLQIIVMELKRAKGTSATRSSSLKLDRIKLLTFGGNYHEWQAFHDLFCTSVHKNSSLSGTEKLIHLKSYLTGDAAAVISAFQATDANYKEAWDTLVKRYNNVREIIFAHIRKFDDLPSLKEESASKLRSLADSINECVRSLTVLKVPVDTWDLIMIYLAFKKLDAETKMEWSLAQEDDLPKLKDFVEFIEKRARALSDSTQSSSGKLSQSRSKSTSSNHITSTKSKSCVKCSETHHHHQCREFVNLTLTERKEVVSKNRLCFNCLFKGHGVATCKMTFSCKKCGKKHHALLHNDELVKVKEQDQVTSGNSPNSVREEGVSNSEVVSSHCINQGSESSVVLLGTLLVSVNNSNGEKKLCRVFVDPGSEPHLVSEQCVDFLGLERKKSCVSLLGIGSSSSGTSRGTVQLTLFSRVRDFKLTVNALIMSKLTGLMPRVECKTNWPHLEGLTLADPSFNKPGQIDILLGAKITALLMLPGLVKGPPDSPFAQNTTFGWMLSGSVASATLNHHIQAVSNHVSCAGQDPCVEASLEKFWELEEPEVHGVPLSVEEEKCEQHFMSIHQRMSDGTYIVELPFNSNSLKLGESRQIAMTRLKQVEIRLSKDPKIRQEYIQQIRAAIAFNHLEVIPEEELYKDEHYYMPHHVVIKEDSETTPYRVVYDASAKTTSGVSLNDLLMTGPKLQEDLIALLIRFRVHRVPLSTDIAKMYNQTRVSSKHTDYQRILWRESPELPVKDYRLLRVTFGVRSAPYLGVRCLHQLAEDERFAFPSASIILKKDFVVDNLLSGASDVESALNLQKELLLIMDRGKLNLRKWASSCSEILEAVPPEKRSSQTPLRIEQSEVIKTIGLLWNPGDDTFSISIKSPPITSHSSKRNVLSTIARIFNPLGWLSPVTIKPKIIMQELWKLKLDWDSPIPLHLQKQWNSYHEELEYLKSMKISRHIHQSSSPHSQNLRYQLHGFCDASQLAYSACMYSRVVDGEGQSIMVLVAAKTKVAPIKKESIPRLELCGALLLTKLMSTVHCAIKAGIHLVRCWTDSTIVLDWLRSNEKLEIFVSNRVRKITNVYSHQQWSHVPGKENPADEASRGVPASTLSANSRWFH